MSRRSSSSSSSSTSSNNVYLALTKALQGITKAEDGFSKSVNTLKELLTETFSDLETRIEAKNKEFGDLKIKFDQEEKNKKIEISQNIREHGYDAAKEILEKRNEIAVSQEDYNNLQENFIKLKKLKDEEVSRAVGAEHERNKDHVEAMRQTLELQKKAEVAQVEARLESQLQHIDVLKETIANLKSDLDEQRKLTKDVAQAAAKQGQGYYPQPSGNNRP
jgi:DNA repair exonuclease SbcCD ATPase subunit